MKKVLSILLAVLMMFATFGMASFAVDEAEDGPEKFSVDDAIKLASQWKDEDTGRQPVVLLFETRYAKIDKIIDDAIVKTITSGDKNKGCTAVICQWYTANGYAVLPYTRDAGEGKTADWQLLTPVEGYNSMITYSNGSQFPITDKAGEQPFLYFSQVLKDVGETPTISKIMGIFYRVIKVLLGDEVANKFINLLEQLGLVIEP